ncbi:MAG: TIGR03915 family putative DNA repair protein [Bacteroidales bacterium]|nr:TIGR03915 family putative DNA repair protein [Bacteroidales bacterium]MCM1414848.1 TIGR03915 family putative DNA repair protein [bacterium]MCM1422479.1 TIGR03915 family putative DNA repair protein [bacterium]
MEEKYLVCEDSLEGIFTGIYDAYALREGHEHIHMQIGEEENLRLFAVYVHIAPDPVKTDKVARTLRTRLGEEAYLSLCRAAASCHPDKGEAVYKTVVDALRKSGRRVMENLTNPQVARCFELARFTANEAHYEIEFLRFQELAASAEADRRLLFAKIGPKNNVIPFVMPHFADRLSVENFMVYDENRRLCGVHPAGEDWYLMTTEADLSSGESDWSAGEREYRELFRTFHRTIAIKNRENRSLQRQMCALRYQDYMPEFEKKFEKK